MTKLGETTGTTELTLPSSFNELVAIILLPNVGKFSIVAPYEVLETNSEVFNTGKPYDPGNAGGACVAINISKTKISMNMIRTCLYNSNTYSYVTNISKLVVFYR